VRLNQPIDTEPHGFSEEIGSLPASGEWLTAATTTTSVGYANDRPRRRVALKVIAFPSS
jgi:hypothetical protein